MLPIRDRLRVIVYDQPLEIGVSFALMFFGMRALITNLGALPGALIELPFWLGVAYCLLSVFGGGATLAGLAGKYRIRWMSGLEKAGLYVSASAWMSYIVGLLFGPFTIRATLVELALGGLVVGTLFRARAITRREMIRRDILLQQLERERE